MKRNAVVAQSGGPSPVDLDEAYQAGRKAVDIGFTDGGGYMATILRQWESPDRTNPPAEYKPYFDKVPLERVANSVRHLPKQWISGNGLDVTDDFIRYARPLIGDGNPGVVIENGLQRFARFEMNLAEKKLPPYVPIRFRQEQ